MMAICCMGGGGGWSFAWPFLLNLFHNYHKGDGMLCFNYFFASAQGRLYFHQALACGN